MKKDAYWFKHDSTSGRGLRMRKMAHIYGHWGKGVYWDVIEILRDQSNYCFDSDDSSLQMLSDLIGCKDDAKFITWFRDCVRLELFILQENKFLSEILCENMHNWETKKDNGNKGGRPKITETITETKPKYKPNLKLTETIREEKSIEEERREDKSKKVFTPPTLDEVKIYFKEKGYSENSGSTAFYYYDSANWVDSKGNKIKNWKQKMIGVWFKEENKESKQATVNGIKMVY